MKNTNDNSAAAPPTTTAAGELDELRARVAELEAWTTEARTVVDSLIAERVERLRRSALEERMRAGALDREAREFEAMLASENRELITDARDRSQYAAAQNGAVSVGGNRVRRRQ